MDKLKAELKLVELKAQIDELQMRPNTQRILMNEQDNCGLEEKFELSANINSLVKEINMLVIQMAPHISLPLHERLSNKSFDISQQILNCIDMVQKLLQSCSIQINSLIQKLTSERVFLQERISLLHIFETELKLWEKTHVERMVSVYRITTIRNSWSPKSRCLKN